MSNKKKSSKRSYSKEKTFDRENSLTKGSGFKANFSTLNGNKHFDFHAKKIKYKNTGNSNISVNYTNSQGKNGSTKCKIPTQHTYDVRGIFSKF